MLYYPIEKKLEKTGAIMKTSDFSFDLPEELIAQDPLTDR
ncbi:S-adenosylmethionine:tRNA ribosyltransferase-isomerase, partial [Anaerostipes caccae]|nr:S-adenosylmethionine:tRNA ribosyltransferase-isomerase [Anaerostipes caccae]